VYYVISDHLGTPQQIVDSSGTVVWKAAFLPFGKAQILTQTITNNIRFPGQYFDAETGLHYNWNRYYDPDTGRYLTPDPIGLDGGLNLYAYVAGDPVNWFDFNGLAKGKNKDRKGLDYSGKDKKKGAEGRKPGRERQRNIGHPDAEEHSRRPKGGFRPKTGPWIFIIWPDEYCTQNPNDPYCQKWCETATGLLITTWCGCQKQI
jgi:RHS repeat-associated protein